MKHTSFLLITLLSGISLTISAQNRFRLQEEHDSLLFTVVVKNHTLMLEYQGSRDLFNRRNDFPQVVEVRLEDADLVLDYRPGKAGEGKLHSIALDLELPDGQTIIQPSSEVPDRDIANGLKQKVWPDVADWISMTGNTYKLRVHRYLMGAVNCDAPYPAFYLRKKIPYYAAGGVGLILVGLGQQFRLQKNDYYATYQRLWREGAEAPPPTDNPLTKARNKNKAFQICTWAGIGILAADALLFTSQHLKIKRKQKDYDRFCGQKPSLQLQPTGQGMGLILNF